MSNTYCIKPFIHIATERNGDYLPCCLSKIPTGYNIEHHSIEEVWNSEYYNKLRHDLLNGVKNPNCERCWTVEDKGYVSRRQQNNQVLDVPLPVPIELDIKTGNDCNLKCITCNHLASSQHAKEVEQWKKDNVKLPLWLSEIDRDELDINNVDNVGQHLDSALPGCSIINLQGGEPFASPMTIKLLEYCKDKGYTNLPISATSNLSSTGILKRLADFPKTTVGVSYDHIDPAKFNFIRFPADLETLERNIVTLSAETDIKWGICFTLSIFNIFDLVDIFKRFEEFKQMRNYSFTQINYVIAPDYFSPEYLELEQKQQLVDIVNQNTLPEEFNDIHKIVNVVPDDFDEVVKERTRVLDLYDKTRGTDYRKLFPYIKRYE